MQVQRIACEAIKQGYQEGEKQSDYAGFPLFLTIRPAVSDLPHQTPGISLDSSAARFRADGGFQAVQYRAPNAEGRGASLIFVYGPTGVGKTTLRQHITSRLIEDAERSEAHQLPVLALEAAAPCGNASRSRARRLPEKRGWRRIRDQ